MKNQTFANRKLCKQFVMLLALFLIQESIAQDFFDWNARTDRYGKPAGIFDITPFPIDENSSTYVIKNDEYPDGRIFELGAKYFVDGAYTGEISDGTFQKPWKNLADALSGSQNGNTTIIVRGTHDSFNGIYIGTYNLSSKAGVDDTHRFMIVGYRQERPVFDGNAAKSDVFRRGVRGNAFITLQRIKVTNTTGRNGFRIGWDITGDKRDGYCTLIDGWFYRCSIETGPGTDGGIYYLNADYGYVSHCTIERNNSHGAKIGDGSSYMIFEWNMVRENGWWPGRTEFSTRNCGIDFPSDREGSTNNIVRYNIMNGCVSHGLQMRRQQNFDIHHNEICNFGYGPGMKGEMRGVVPYGVMLFEGETSGRFRQNIIHDPSPYNPEGILLTVSSKVATKITIDNNLFYGSLNATIEIDRGNLGDITFYNNSIYQDNSSAVIILRVTGAGTKYDFSNNTIYQAGTGICADMVNHDVPPLHTYNQWYYPGGGAPEWGTDGPGERVEDPVWKKLPKGKYQVSFAQLKRNSPGRDKGTDLGSDYSITLQNVRRPQGTAWDIGANEYNP